MGGVSPDVMAEPLLSAENSASVSGAVPAGLVGGAAEGGRTAGGGGGGGPEAPGGGGGGAEEAVVNGVP